MDLTAGEHHTCALLEGRRAVCWGRNSSGQLGNGAIDNNRGDPGNPPVEVGLVNVIALDAGGTHTCAVDARRRIYCWGYNSSSQVGDLSTVTRPVPVLVETVPTGRRTS